MWDLEIKPYKVAHFFKQGNDLAIKVDLQLEGSRGTIVDDLEDISRNR